MIAAHILIHVEAETNGERSGRGGSVMAHLCVASYNSVTSVSIVDFLLPDAKFLFVLRRYEIIVRSSFLRDELCWTESLGGPQQNEDACQGGEDVALLTFENIFCCLWHCESFFFLVSSAMRRLTGSRAQAMLGWSQPRTQALFREE